MRLGFSELLRYAGMRERFAVSARILRKCITRDKKLIELSYEYTDPVSRRIIPNIAMFYGSRLARLTA
jgi:hypothetical protein